MRKITLTNDFRRNRTSFENAKAAFIKFCKLKNLTERTIEFYEEDLMYLQNYVNAKYLDEIKKPVWIRHVVVPGITQDEAQLTQFGEFLKTLSKK